MTAEWTDDRVEKLKNLWLSGLTARQTAEKLGGVTRNAVIGKAHRMGLSQRPQPVKRKVEPAPSIGRAERTCQWPIGHPGSNEFHFCGKPAEAGRPYCTSHCHQAYRRPKDNAA